jgi:hypothetical protein
MKLTLTLSLLIRDDKIINIIQQLKDIGISARVERDGYTRRELIIDFTDHAEPTKDEILSLGVLIGQTLYMD